VPRGPGVNANSDKQTRTPGLGCRTLRTHRAPRRGSTCARRSCDQGLKNSSSDEPVRATTAAMEPGYAEANARIASVVASAALNCGQCPVASRVTS
jgi:hypothetical protein